MNQPLSSQGSETEIHPEPASNAAENAADSGIPAVNGDADAREAIIARRLATIASPKLAVPIILAFGILLYLVNLGGYPLYTKGEPREAVTISEIVHGEGVILPMRAGVEIPSKPLMMHWLAAIVCVIAGVVNEWTVRIPSAALAIGSMLVCYLYVRRMFEERGALFAALILGTAAQCLQAGTGCRVDMTLTFFMEVAFFEFLMIAEGLSTRTTLLYLVLAFAVLTKGPIGVALPALVGAIWMLLWRRFEVWKRLKVWRGVLIVGGLAGGWYLAAIATGGMAFVHKQILAENIYRLFHHRGVDDGHAHPFYYEEGALLAGFMPWSLVAIPAAVQWIRRPRKLDPRFSYLVVWFLTVLIFYNLPQSKRGVYLLALYPALAAIVALFMSDAISHRAPAARWIRRISSAEGAFFVVTGVGALVGLALLHIYPAPITWILARFRILVTSMVGQLRSASDDYLALSILIPLATAAVGIYLLRARSSAEKLVFSVAAGFGLIALAINLVIQPAVANSLTLKGFTARVMQTVGSKQVGYIGSIDYDFAFYSGRPIDFVLPHTTNPPPYIVASQDGYRLMNPELRNQYTIMFRSGPTDLNNTGWMYLLERNDLLNTPPASSEPTKPATS